MRWQRNIAPAANYSMLPLSPFFLLFVLSLGCYVVDSQTDYCRLVDPSYCFGDNRYYSRAGNSDNALNGILKKLYATPSFGDIDADGDLDLILGDLDGSIQLYYNHGNATAPDFDSSPSTESIFASIGVANYAQPILGDFNGDGLLDLVVASPGRISTFVNIGNSTSPRFTASNPDYAFTHWFDHIANTSSYLYKLSASDYDGDGDLDIIVGVTAEQSICSLFYYENTGDKYTPLFVDQTKNMFGYSAVRVPGFGGCGAFGADIDGDGDRDLVVLSDRLLHYYENIGSGLYPQWEYRDAEASNPFSFFVSNSFSKGGAVAVDLYAEGVDLVVVPTSHEFVSMNLLRSYKYTSVLSTSYSEVLGSANPFVDTSVTRFATVALIDFDQSSVSDLMVVQSLAGIDYVDYDPAVHYYKKILTQNDASGQIEISYADVTDSAEENPFYNFHFPLQSAQAADMDGDGDLDLVVSSYAGLAIIENESGPNKRTNIQWKSPLLRSFMFDAGTAGSFASPAMVDTDADGDLDMAVCVSLEGIIFVENIGSSILPEWNQLSVFNENNPFLSVNSLKLDGTLTFNRCDLSFADIDGDGDFDMLLAELDGRLTFFVNTGTNVDPSYSSVLRKSAADPFRHYDIVSALSAVVISVSFGDLDLDGDIDMVLSEGSDHLLFLENIGNMTHAKYWVRNSSSPDFLLAGVDAIGPVRLVDLDDDSDLDLVIMDGATMAFYESKVRGTLSRRLWQSDVREEGYYYSYGDDGGSTPEPVPSPCATSTSSVDPSNSQCFSKKESLSTTINLGSNVRPAFGDLNADSHVDMMLGMENLKGGLLHFENISNGVYAEDMCSIQDSRVPKSVTVADMNGDGVLELIFPSSNGNLYQCENIGSLTNPIFTLTFLGLSSLGDPTAVAVHDVDDDGDMDIILSLSSSIVVYENSGDPSTPFSHSNQATLDGIDGVSPSILLSDVDLDGDMDVILGGNDGMVRLYANGRCFPVNGKQCSKNGACVDNEFYAKCTCFTGFTGDQCNACQNRFYGVQCDVCPGGGIKSQPNLQSVCSQQGVCSDGYTGSGNCSCTAPFGGDCCEFGTCPSGEQRLYNETLGTYGCAQCPIGYIKSEVLGVCVECEDGRSTVGLGSTSCEVCPVNNYYDSEKDDCYECENGMQCSITFRPVYLESLYIESGRFRTHRNSKKVEHCPYRDACLGGNTTGEESCTAGNEGPLCAVCSHEYYYSITTNSCLSCTGHSIAGSFLSAGLALVVIIAFLMLSLRCCNWKSRGKFMVKHTLDTIGMLVGTSLRKQSQSDGVVVFHRDYIGDRRASRAVRIADNSGVNPLRKFQSKLKIVVSLFQIVTSLPWTLSITFPPIFSWFLSVLYLFNFEASGIVPMNCITSTNFLTELIATTFSPIVVSAMIGMAALFSRFFAKPAGGEETSTNAVYFRLFLLCTYVVYPGVCLKIFRGLRPCHKLDDGNSYMVEDYSIQCNSKTYHQTVGLCYIMAVVYAIGIPVLYTTLLFRNRKNIRKEGENREFAVSVLQKKLEENDFGETIASNDLAMEMERLNWCYPWTGDISSFDFLFSAYGPELWWWEILETARRLLLTGLLVFFIPGSASQVVIALLIAVLCGMMYVGFSPFMDSMDTVLSNTSQVSLILVLFASLCIQLEIMDGEEYTVFLGIILVTIVVLVPVVGCVCVLLENKDHFYYALWGSGSGVERRVRKASQVSPATATRSAKVSPSEPEHGTTAEVNAPQQATEPVGSTNHVGLSDNILSREPPSS